MTHSVYAFVYNPFTKTESVYIETDKTEAELSIFSFTKSQSYYLKRCENKLESLIGTSVLQESEESSTPHEDYIHWVYQIKELIASQPIIKVIAAQKEVSEKTLPLRRIPSLLKTLVDRLPNTFIYFYFFDKQAWLGASPELIGRTSNGVFSTISLAGTTNTAIPQFTSKEIDEQGIVSNFIENILKNYNGQVHRNRTQSLAFGAISHLVDEYTTQITHPDDFRGLIEQIHPSPALSGFPKDLSMSKITAYEPIQREWYCGHSVLTEDNEQYSFAHIRCAKISENQIIYYAGAGITVDSDPGMEYEETKNKINILKKIIE